MVSKMVTVIRQLITKMHLNVLNTHKTHLLTSLNSNRFSIKDTAAALILFVKAQRYSLNLNDTY